MALVINVLLYQAVWFLCVFYGDKGALLSLGLILGHLLWTPCRKADLLMMAILLGCGLLIDGVMHLTGYISFTVTAQPIPLWLAVIWLALALLVHHSLSWLKTRLVLSAFFGAIGGPLAYWAGVKAGAAAFGVPPSHSLILLSVVWAFLWPVVMFIGQQILPKTTGSKAKAPCASARLNERDGLWKRTGGASHPQRS